MIGETAADFMRKEVLPRFATLAKPDRELARSLMKKAAV